jgi:hypothetical protein
MDSLGFLDASLEVSVGGANRNTVNDGVRAGVMFDFIVRGIRNDRGKAPVRLITREGVPCGLDECSIARPVRPEKAVTQSSCVNA